MTRPFGDPEVLARLSAQTVLNELAARIQAERALRACDDAATWNWRRFLRERRDAL